MECASALMSQDATIGNPNKPPVSAEALCRHAADRGAQPVVTGVRAGSVTFSSMLLSMQNRYTWTSFFCPMRCARSMACRSICGFLHSHGHKISDAHVPRLDTPASR